MTRIARVETLKERGPVIRLIEKKGAEQHSCCSRSFRFVERREPVFLAKNPSQLPLAPGTLVEIRLLEGRALGDAFFAFLAPLFLFLLVFFLSGWLFPFMAEGLRVLLGSLGLLSGFVLGRAFRSRSQASLPTVLRLLPLEEIDGWMRRTTGPPSYGSSPQDRPSSSGDACREHKEEPSSPCCGERCKSKKAAPPPDSDL